MFSLLLGISSLLLLLGSLLFGLLFRLLLSIFSLLFGFLVLLVLDLVGSVLGLLLLLVSLLLGFVNLLISIGVVVIDLLLDGIIGLLLILGLVLGILLLLIGLLLLIINLLLGIVLDLLGFGALGGLLVDCSLHFIGAVAGWFFWGRCRCSYCSFGLSRRCSSSLGLGWGDLILSFVRRGACSGTRLATAGGCGATEQQLLALRCRISALGGGGRDLGCGAVLEGVELSEHVLVLVLKSNKAMHIG